MRWRVAAVGITGVLALAGCSGASVATPSASSQPPTTTATTTPLYAYPKAYAWSRAHLQDVNAVLSDATTIWDGMQSCNLQPGQYACPPSTPPSADPGNWIERLPEDCTSLTTDVSTAQSDGPIPNAQAQGWWQQSLADFTQACSAIATASAAEQTALQDGVTGYDANTQIPGGQAASDLEAGEQLVQHAGTFVTAKR